MDTGIISGKAKLGYSPKNRGEMVSQPGVKIRIRFAIITCGMVSLFHVQAVRADLADQFGVSARAIGMGNAYTALADDYGGLYYNPAGLANKPRDVLTFGYLMTAPRVKIKSRNGTDRLAFTHGVKGGLIGYRMDTGAFFSEKARRNIVMGLTAIFPDNFKTYVNADTKFYDELQFPVIGRVHDLAAVFLGGGIKIHPMVSVGASMRLVFTSDIRDLTIVYNATTFNIDYKKLDINAETEAQPIFGIVCTPSDTLRIGAVWRKGGSPVHFLGSVNVTVDTGFFLLPLPSLTSLFYEFYTPEQTALSIAYGPFNGILVAAELEYAAWSKYDLPYGERPPGRPMHDIVIPRIGIEYMLNQDISLRIGYYYHPSPVRSRQKSTWLLDSDQHVVSAGVGYLWHYVEHLIGYPLEIDLYLQFQYMPKRSLHTLDVPTSVWGHSTNAGCTVQFRF